jgi:hypothetical protein
MWPAKGAGCTKLPELLPNSPPTRHISLFGWVLTREQTDRRRIRWVPGRQQIVRGSFSLGHDKEVFDAEAEAALAAIKAATDCPTARFANDRPMGIP